MTESPKICVGVIAAAHGIRGQVRLRSFTDDPESIFAYTPLTDESGKQTFKFKRDGVAKNDFVVTVQGTPDRNAAEALRGTNLFYERAKLPKAKKNQYYEFDLIGLAARDAQGKAYGKLLAVHDFGAGIIFEIGATKKDSFILPVTDACIPEVNPADGFILIAPPDGWLSSK